MVIILYATNETNTSTVPSPIDSITRADRVNLDRLVTRDIVLGSQIVTGPYHLGSEVPMRGKLGHDGKIDSDADLSESEFLPVHTNSNATRTQTSYLAQIKTTSFIACVEIILHNGHFTVQAVRTDSSDKDTFFIEVRADKIQGSDKVLSFKKRRFPATK